MNKIKLLPESVYNKIAAGEVVQRPSSVVKELFENSIDSGANSITLVIKEAGKKIIQVTDNGSGIAREDMQLTIQKHATSKLSNIEDLDSLITFGFRGEALSSVAAVSTFEIKSKIKESQIGYLLKFESENEIKIEETPAIDGTTVSVRNLFYNVPARRNFLRADKTEFKNILDTFKLFALSYPEIEFKLVNDGKKIYDFKSDLLLNRINLIFGENFNNLLIEINEETELLKVRGFIAQPTFLSNSKGKQFSFVNGRFVKSKTINHAVFSSYEDLLQKGDYPFFVLFLEIDQNNVDINIHPSKEEIKFYDEIQIYNLIKAVIKKSLGSYDYISNVSKNIEKKITKKEIISENSYKENEFDDLDSLFAKVENEIQGTNSGNIISHPFLQKQKESIVEHKIFNENVEENSDTKFIHLLHNKYIVSQIRSGLMFIDFHEAKRKIFYEKAVKNLKQISTFPQQLLFPERVQLTKTDFEVLQKNDRYFRRLGFEIKYLSRNTIDIVGVPTDVSTGNEKEVFRSIFKDILSNENISEKKVNEFLAETFANNLANQNVNSNEQYLRLIVDQLFASSNPNYGIDGKKIIEKISLDEIAKKFDI